MRIVFMGTPEFAAVILEELVQHHDVAAVYTRPDAIRGRGREATPSPVKALAEEFGIPVFTPQSLKDDEVQARLHAFEADIIAVAAYGMLLPREVLEIPKYGCLNVHASLLPRWRGAAPIERAILEGDEMTGVCVMRMEEGLDTGDYCVCRTLNIDDKGSAELNDELANLGSQALLTALIHLERGAGDWTHQDEAQASYAPKLDRGELFPKSADGACRIVRKIRASSAAHPARVQIAGKSASLLKARLVPEEDKARGVTDGLVPGMTCFREKRLFIGAADDAVEILSLKPDGKNAMDAKAFAAGIPGLKTQAMHWEELHV